MNAQVLAEIITDIRSLILLAASLVCCFGVVHFFLGKTIYQIGKRPTGRRDWDELLLSGSIAGLICSILLMQPFLLFVPIVLFFFVCRSDKRRNNNC